MNRSSSHFWAAAGAPALVLAASRGAHADVIPPPTLVVDFFWLGWPVGPVVGLALLVGTVFLYRRLRKSGKSRLRAGAISLVLFAACNLACYVWGLGHRRRSYPRPLPDFGRVDGPSEQDTTR